MSYLPCVGTVIHGTLRPEDLIPAFAYELNLCHGREGRNMLHLELLDAAEFFENSTDEEQHYLLQELMEALNTYAPMDCYFGAHQGDGSDFGFWPAE
jgi:hypothetical protein